jgi:hypothetical protein
LGVAFTAAGLGIGLGAAILGAIVAIIAVLAAHSAISGDIFMLSSTGEKVSGVNRLC